MAKQPGPPERNVQPTLSMEIFRQQFLKLIEQHAGTMENTVMLGVTAYATGQMMQMCKQEKKYKDPQIVELVTNNIELGSKDTARMIAEGKL